ncbi:MAG: hypothetical protein FWC07_13155, partial [Defluviitaleaceae bacterium]|nr:hypothetical protein [Defluviitaleaceae bacterium]
PFTYDYNIGEGHYSIQNLGKFIRFPYGATFLKRFAFPDNGRSTQSCREVSPTLKYCLKRYTFIDNTTRGLLPLILYDYTRKFTKKQPKIEKLFVNF